MKFIPTPLGGAYLVEMERQEDERGYFARTWCQGEFAAQGLNPSLVQCSVSFNRRKGTLRGMHYQKAPHAEAKLVRCTRGAIFDAIVDLRPESPTYRQWAGFELAAQGTAMLYIPQGLAHGFLTLADDSEVFYQMSEFFYPDCAAGVRWNDAAFGIAWPAEPKVVSLRDRNYPDYQP